jgi:hypothetical protein
MSQTAPSWWQAIRDKETERLARVQGYRAAQSAPRADTKNLEAFSRQSLAKMKERYRHHG